MSFLSWIKNRDAAAQPDVTAKPQQQKPETAKQMYSREAAVDKANRIAPTPDQEARAKAIGEEMRKVTQAPERNASAPSNAPGDAGSNAAQLQKASHQDKPQQALSPTDGTAGKTAVQDKPKAQEKTPQRAQTVPRRPPSWER